MCKIYQNPRRLYIRYAFHKLNAISKSLSDEEYLSQFYKIMFGKRLNLSEPKTFNEKMQWLKLYNRNPSYTVMVDKHLSKRLVSRIIGDNYVAKEYGCWDSFDEIDFANLPNSFVLKTTHGCGTILICKNKCSCDYLSYRDTFQQSLEDNFYYHLREWPYKDVEPKIIAEEYLSDGQNSILPVYKFFCFNGAPYLVQVIQNDKQYNESIDYMDMKWNRLKLKQNFPNSKVLLPKPECFEKMKEVCTKLTKGIPFVRCDLYAIGTKIYFSEFTFFSDAGFEPFHPKKWDLILGEKIILPPICIN